MRSRSFQARGRLSGGSRRCARCGSSSTLQASVPYPFLFLNWLLTVVSTFQSPLILLSQNRQNEMDRDRMRQIMTELRELRKAVEQLKA